MYTKLLNTRRFPCLSSSVGAMKSLRDAFYARRLERGITQEAVAQAARLTRKTVSDFENGNSSISAANLSRLLAVVGLELARDLNRRPHFDELAQRYNGEEAEGCGPRRRACWPATFPKNSSSVARCRCQRRGRRRMRLLGRTSAIGQKRTSARQEELALSSMRPLVCL